jgi:ATP-dependent helicase HrpB
VAWRLWREHDRLRPHREPDIHRIDLSGPLLDVLAWGGNPRKFEWFDPPAADALDGGLDLLERLGAFDERGLTAIGREMPRLPLHPRLARILLAAGGSREAALACALLSERNYLPPRGASTTSDLLSAVEHERELPPHVRHVAAELQRLAAGGTRTIDETAFRRAMLAGYPDRVARRREAGSPRVLLASGHGAVVGNESGVREGAFLVAHDVQAGRRGEGSEARIRVATAIDAEWLPPGETSVEHEFVRDSGSVRAYAREYYGALVLSERVVAADPLRAAELLAVEYLRKPLREADEQLLRRLRFADLAQDLGGLVARAAHGKRALDEIDLAEAIDWSVRQDLERLAPACLTVPSGRTHAIEYGADGSVSASVKLQELFGLAETPRIGPRREPVVFLLLAPNGRPVQTTKDLRSFWENTYPEVRRELRGRYPKHPWPEDPWTATPTAKTRKRAGGV